MTHVSRETTGTCEGLGWPVVTVESDVASEHPRTPTGWQHDQGEPDE